MYYYPPHEDVSFKYSVAVRPPPADSGNVRFLKHEKDGEVLDEQTLEVTGSGHPLSMSLSGRTIDDSPIWVELEWEKAESSPEITTLFQVVSLAEAGVLEIDMPEDVKAGESVKAKVGQWAALAYDLPGEVTVFEEPDAARVSGDAKGEVTWSVDGVEVSTKGEEVDVETSEDDAGKEVLVEAWIGEQDPKAQFKLKIPKLSIMDGTKPAAEVVAVGRIAKWSCKVEPPVEGTYVFEISAGDAGKATLTHEHPDEAFLELHGYEAVPEDQKLTLKCTLTSAATGNTFEVEHEFRFGGQRVKIRLEDDEGILAETPYTLEVGDQSFEGTTDAEGVLLEEVPADAKKGLLKFTVDDEEFEFPIHVPDHAVKDDE
jgi:hypothetical protein